MLDAMESNAKGNNNLTIKVISSEYVEEKYYILKKYGKSKRKNLNLFFPFSKLLPWTTSLKVIFSGRVLYFQIGTSVTWPKAAFSKI